MSQRERVVIFPSRANLVMMKQRIVGATRGLNLLKRKRDALDMKLRELAGELRKSQEIIDSVMHEAMFSMTKARFLDTDFKPATVMGPDRADVFMRVRNHKVAGLLLPTFDLYMYPSKCFALTGLSRGGEQVEVVRQKFQEAVKALITFASLEYAVRVLEDGVRQNNMRINGLDYVVIPRFVNTVNYIRDELEEYEREDFYRLKRSQAKQRNVKEAFAKMMRERSGEAPKQPKELAYGTNEEFNMSAFAADAARPKKSPSESPERHVSIKFDESEAEVETQVTSMQAESESETAPSEIDNSAAQEPEPEEPEEPTEPQP